MKVSDAARETEQQENNKAAFHVVFMFKPRLPGEQVCEMWTASGREVMLVGGEQERQHDMKVLVCGMDSNGRERLFVIISDVFSAAAFITVSCLK